MAKKILTAFISLCVCLSFTFVAYAGSDEEITQDSSTPRLIVTDYELSSDYITPNSKETLKVTLKNYSSKKALTNIILSINDESGEVKTTDVGYKYVNCIYAGSAYVWEIELQASKTATIGEHNLTLTAEYEDKYYNSYSTSNTVSVTVNQEAKLEFDGLTLPSYIYQKETSTLTVNFMNTGKCTVKNCKIEFDIDGLESGGDVYVGDIEQGDSASVSVNLLATADTIGELKGTATVCWEDEMGNSDSEKVELLTTCKEAVEVVADDEQEEEEEKYKFWYLFLIGGLVLGGGVGAAVPISIQSRKRRKEDELRL